MTAPEPYNDAFLISIARRATQCLDPDDSPNEEATIYTALGVSIFRNWLSYSDSPSESTGEIVGVCYRELVRELTPQRLKCAQQLDHLDAAPYVALVLDILGSCAVKMSPVTGTGTMRPDLRDKFDEIEEFILEEYNADRVLELKAATVH